MQPRGGRVRPTIQQWAGFYQQSLGWQPVPLLPGDKKCTIPNWQTTTFRPEDFGPAANLGIKSIDGHVVFDDDSAKRGLALGAAFLPDTRAVFGRPSAPRSKGLYFCPTLDKTRIWEDLDRNHLAELRVGQQDMFPPSTHPDGEKLTWAGPLWNGMLPETSADALISACNLRAAAALLALYWPDHGRRELLLAYANVFLSTLGLSDDVATKVLVLAATLGKFDSDGLDKARRAVSSTRAKLDTGRPSLGTGHIRRTLPRGPELVRRLREWFGKTHDLDEAVEQINDTHALVFQQSGGMVVLTEDTEDGQPHLRFSRPSDMALLYPQSVQVGAKKNGDPIVKARGSVWLTHSARRFYRGIEVAPNDRGNEGYYNMWRGFSVEPKKGDWPLFRQHLSLVANGNIDHAKYIFGWMAETVQHPERPIGIALAFKGKQGTGKSTFAKWFGKLFGVHFLHLDSEQHLLGRFNAHLHNAILVLADEAVWAGSKAGLGALKRMITEDTLNIERKNVDILTVKNMLHMMVASNESWVVPTGFDNRRFAIFGTSAEHQDDAKFFAAVDDELFKRDGLAALLYDLLEYENDIDLRQIPETENLIAQQALSANPEESWWLEKLHQGLLAAVWAEGGWPDSGRVSKDVIHQDYLQFLDTHQRRGRSPRATETELGRFLKTRTPLSDGRARLIHGERQRIWTVPSLAECREAWARECKWSEAYPWDE
jgi:hypothetical protein